MRIVENFPPPPPKPLRTFDLRDVSEEELRELFATLGCSKSNYDLYVAIGTALGDEGF